MENHKLVLPEHMNHFGFLFGGYLLTWIDEVAWIAASLEFPGHNFVTIGLDKVEFRESVNKGTILKFKAEQIRKGTTSVTYEVNVTRARIDSGGLDPVFTTRVTLVCVDGDGKKIAF
ncbi:MAG: acyl-CoA hydrolase [Verrucomicrobiales bacterium]|jgi:acyl-CoA hydrolase